MSKPTRTHNIAHARLRRSLKEQRHVCSTCSWPARSSRGLALHQKMMHGDHEFGERNWNICYAVFTQGKTVSEVSGEYDLSTKSIQRILWRALAFPDIYELEIESIAKEN